MNTTTERTKPKTHFCNNCHQVSARHSGPCTTCRKDAGQTAITMGPIFGVTR